MHAGTVDQARVLWWRCLRRHPLLSLLHPLLPLVPPQPNDQRSEYNFNFRRTSSVQLKVFGVDVAALDDITERLQALVAVLESAEGSLTVC